MQSQKYLVVGSIFYLKVSLSLDAIYMFILSLLVQLSNMILMNCGVGHLDILIKQKCLWWRSIWACLAVPGVLPVMCQSNQRLHGLVKPCMRVWLAVIAIGMIMRWVLWGSSASEGPLEFHILCHTPQRHTCTSWSVLPHQSQHNLALCHANGERSCMQSIMQRFNRAM